MPRGRSLEEHLLTDILICPNAFKGSLTALDAARAIERGLENARAGAAKGSPASGWRPVLVPVADGGDGTLETLVTATGGVEHRLEVRGPLGAPVTARWGRLGGERADTAVIEMAEAAGLRLLARGEEDPMRASTYGVGQLIRAAVDSGCRRLLVGIGGSATNDAGAGMASALGFRLLDDSGCELAPGGASLLRLSRIDMAAAMDLSGVEVVVACDVDNPLCGPEGASAVYGPQKGATPGDTALLDAALGRFARVMEATIGRDLAQVPGAGAAGGLGAGMMGFCGARLSPGTAMVLDTLGFDEAVRCAALVITGEGRLDGQTARGKVVAGVAKRAAWAGVPCVALVGASLEGAEQVLRAHGLTAALSIMDGPMSVEAAMNRGAGLLEAAAERLMRIWAAGSGARS